MRSIIFSKIETLTHFIKAFFGMGVYSMPLAFKHAGLLTGLIATFASALLIVYYILVLLRCAHILCRNVRKPSMTYFEVTEAAFANGTKNELSR